MSNSLNNTQIRRYLKTDTFSVLSVGFLIATSASPFFIETVHPSMVGATIFGLLFIRKRLVIQKEIIYVLLFIFIIQMGQVITTKVMLIKTMAGLHLRFLLAYFILRLLKTDFFLVFFKFVYIMAIISLVIYIPSSIFPQMVEFLTENISPYVQAPFIGPTDYRPHIIIYDFSSFYMYRFGHFGLNSGFYWEPGVHAIFLIFALMINTFIHQRILSKKNLVLIFTILTTFSTTGYVALFIFLGIYLFLQRKYKPANLIIILPVVLIVSWLAYNRLEFLKPKIDRNIEMMQYEEMQGSRFQSFWFDLQLWKKYPFFGIDRFAEEGGDFGRVKEWDISLHRNNGIGLLLSTYGIIAFLLYFYGIYKGVKIFSFRNKLDKHFTNVFFIMLIILHFGMPLLLRPVFYAMAILPIVNKLPQYPVLYNDNSYHIKKIQSKETQNNQI